MTTVEPAVAELERLHTFSEVYSDALRGESCTVRGSEVDAPLPGARVDCGR